MQLFATSLNSRSLLKVEWDAGMHNITNKIPDFPMNTAIQGNLSNTFKTNKKSINAVICHVNKLNQG